MSLVEYFPKIHIESSEHQKARTSITKSPKERQSNDPLQEYFEPKRAFKSNDLKALYNFRRDNWVRPEKVTIGLFHT